MMQRYHSLKIKLISITARGSRVARDIFDEDEFNKERGTRRRFANGVFVPCSVYFLRLSDDRYMQT